MSCSTMSAYAEARSHRSLHLRLICMQHYMCLCWQHALAGLMLLYHCSAHFNMCLQTHDSYVYAKSILQIYVRQVINIILAHRQVIMHV